MLFISGQKFENLRVPETTTIAQHKPKSLNFTFLLTDLLLATEFLTRLNQNFQMNLTLLLAEPTRRSFGLLM